MARAHGHGRQHGRVRSILLYALQRTCKVHGQSSILNFYLFIYFLSIGMRFFRWQISKFSMKRFKSSIVKDSFLMGIWDLNLLLYRNYLLYSVNRIVLVKIWHSLKFKRISWMIMEKVRHCWWRNLCPETNPTELTADQVQVKNHTATQIQMVGGLVQDLEQVLVVVLHHVLLQTPAAGTYYSTVLQIYRLL